MWKKRRRARFNRVRGTAGRGAPSLEAPKHPEHSAPERRSQSAGSAAWCEALLLKKGIQSVHPLFLKHAPKGD